MSLFKEPYPFQPRITHPLLLAYSMPPQDPFALDRGLLGEKPLPLPQPALVRWPYHPQEEPQEPPPPPQYPYQPQQWTPQPSGEGWSQIQGPPVQPPKKRGWGKIFAIGCGGLVALVVLITIIVAAASAGNNNASTNATDTSATQAAQQVQQDTPTTQPTQAPQTWTTTHSYSGSGIKKTEVFTVPGDWKINWKCTPSSFYGGSYNVQVYVYNSDGSLADVAINEICSNSNTSGSTEEHQGGDIYLEVNSEGNWVVSVQELQ